MRRVENQYMDYEDRSFGGPSPNDYQDGIFSGQFNFGQPYQGAQYAQPQQGMFGPAPVQPVQPVQPIQPVQPVQPPSPTDNLIKQILGQGTSNWSGAGHGSAEANAADMAKILAGIGITDVNQFGRITRPVDIYMGTDESGNPIYQTQEEQTFGNKLTGQAVPLTYSERQKGDFFGGTFAGKGNTGYGVQFDEQGNPRFYTQGASSSDIGKLAPLLTMAQFVPGLAPIAQGLNALIAAKSGNVLGAISGAAGLGGLTDIANAANFAGALKSGNPLAAITTGANLGGIDLGGLVDASGVKDFTRIGDYDITDVVKAAQTAKAIKSGDPSAIISAIGGYMGGQDNQRTPSAEDLVPPDYYNVPSDGSSAGAYNAPPRDSSVNEEPTTSRFANREAPDPFASVGTEPMPSIEMPDLGSTFPSFISEPSKANQSFNSAFADARARGQSVFEWNGKPYTTELAPPKQPTYDSVGGGRGGQGGATAEELAAYNRSQTPIAVAKPKTAGDLFTSLFPSAEAGSLPTAKGPDLASQIPGYSPARSLAPGEKYDVPPSKYDENNSIFGRVADELGLPQEFQRNVSNTLNAIPGVNLPVGALRGLNAMGRAVGAADELGASKYLDEAGRYIPGSNAYKAPEYASEATRFTADPMKLFKMIDALPSEVYQTSSVQNALKALANNDNVAAFKALESNPAAKKALLNYAEKMGAQEVSLYKNLNLFNPPKYRAREGGGYIERTGGGGRAEGGLASLNKSNKR